MTTIRVGLFERPPEPLAGPVPDGEAVRVVHLGARVRQPLAAVLAEPEHRGQGGDAQAPDVPAQEEAVLDLHDRAGGPPDREPEGAGEARAVEQRVDHDRVVLGGGRRDPVGDEVGELLGAGAADVDRDAAGRHPPPAHPADGAEVGAAQEAGPDLAPARLVGEAALADPEAGEAVRVGRQLAGRAVLRDREVVGRVEDLARDAALEDVHPHRLREELAEEDEGDRVDARAVAGQRVLGPEAQLVVRVVVDPPDRLRRRHRRRDVGPRRQLAGALDQSLEAERLGRPEPQARLGGQGQGRCGDERQEA